MIEVKHVTKKYGNFTAVDDINFTIKNDEIVGFLGPNGAGKSTTMNMITGYIEPTSGKIIVNDYEIIQKWKAGLSKNKLAEIYRRQFNQQIRIIRSSIRHRHDGKFITNYESLAHVEKIIYKYLKNNNK